MKMHETMKVMMHTYKKAIMCTYNLANIGIDVEDKVFFDNVFLCYFAVIWMCPI